MGVAPRFRLVDGAALRRVALLSVHTSPLDQPGTGDGGGLNVFVLEVSRGLAARGVEVDVFTRAASPDAVDSVEVAPRLVVHRVAAGPLAPLAKDELASQLCGLALALRHHPTAGSHDLLHAHYWLSGWVGRRLASRWDVPLVQTFHTLGVVKNASLAPGDTPEPALRLSAERCIAHAADRVVGLTCHEARLLHRRFGLSGARIAVVPAGVDLDVFHPDDPAGPADGGVTGAGGGGPVGAVPAGRAAPPMDPATADARRAIARGAHHWPGPDDAAAPRLLFVGRLQPLKGPDVAIATLAAVRRVVPAARLLVVGGTSGSGHGRTEPDDLVQLATELGVADAVRVVPALPQQSLAQLYRVADVLLAPSRSETFGLVALEAQACGTPVVGTRVPGLEHVVGGGGTLVAGHDPADHAVAVLRYLTDPAAAAAASAAGVRTGATSSWDRTVDRLLSVYAGVRCEHDRRSAVPARVTAAAG